MINLKTILGSSPRTTIFGSIVGICGVLIPLVPPKWKPVLEAVGGIATILWGRSAKDSNGITATQDIVVAKSTTNLPPDKTLTSEDVAKAATE